MKRSIVSKFEVDTISHGPEMELINWAKGNEYNIIKLNLKAREEEATLQGEDL